MADNAYTQVFEIEEPNTGKRYKVEGVDGTTRDEAIQYLSSLPEEEIAKREIKRPNAMLGANADETVATKTLEEVPGAREYANQLFSQRLGYGEAQQKLSEKFPGVTMMPEQLDPRTGKMIGGPALWAEHLAAAETPEGKQYYENNGVFAPINRPTGVEDVRTPDSLLEETGTSALRTGYEMANTVRGAGALVADIVGADETAQALADDYLEQQAAIGQNYPTSAGSAVDIRSFDDFGKWAASVVGQTGTQIATSLGFGALGGIVARKIIERKAADFIEQRVAEGGIREIAEAEVARQIQKATVRGGVAGAAVPSEVQEVGSIYPETYGATGELKPWTSLLAGTAAASLDTILPARILSKVGGPVANDIIVDKLVKKVGKEGAAGFLLEGGTEALQTIIEQLPAGEVDWDSVVEAGLRGGFGGSVVSGAAGAYEGVRQKQMASRLPSEPASAVPEGSSPITAPAATGRRTKAYREEIENTRSQVADRVQSLTSSWENAPQIEVHKSFKDLKGVPNTAVGVYANGKLQINTEQLIKEAKTRGKTLDEMTASLTYHEGLGHHGLALEFGQALDDKLATILDQSTVYKQRVDKWLAKYPDAYEGDPNRDVRALEEILAETSEKGRLPKSFVNVMKNTVKDFGRRMGLDLQYSTREVETILDQAHAAVIMGKGRDVRSNGFRFMYAGEKALTAHAGRLEFAKSLDRAGIDNEKVRRGTGWFKGPDNKWRFEIDDSTSRTRSLNDKDTEWMEDNSGDQFNTIHADSWQGYYALDALTQPRFPRDSLPLDKVLNHPELFEAYPELRNITVYRRMAEVADPDITSNRGVYNPAYNQIYINSSLPDYIAHNVLLHEIQHAIQEIEDFSRGGSPDSALLAIDDSNLLKGARQYVKWVKKNIPAYTPVAKQERDKFLSTFRNMIEQKDIPGLRDFFKGDIKAKFEAYQHLFGEVEARDVQNRQDFTVEERREWRPYESEHYNVDPESYIIDVDNQGPANATVWHGSPHDFEEFDHSKMGSGEGAQVYGWGTYLTETRSIAQQYRDKLSNSDSSMILTNANGEKVVLSKWANQAEIAEVLNLDVNNAARSYPAQYMMNEIARGFTIEEAEKTTREDYSHYPDQEGVEWAIQQVKTANPQLNNGSGKVYEVEIPDNAKWIDWDVRLSEQKEVLKALKKVGFTLAKAEEIQKNNIRLNQLENELHVLQYFENPDKKKIQKIAQEVSYRTSFRDTAISIGGTGHSLYKQLERKIGKPKDVSEFLYRLGFTGTKYRDGFTRGKDGKGTYNYVSYNDKVPRIVNKYMMVSKPENVQFTPEEIESMTPEELLNSQDAMKILTQMTEGYEPVIMSLDDIEKEVQLRDLRPSTVLRKNGVGAGELVKRLYMYDIAMTKVNDRLTSLWEKIQSGNYTQQDKYNFITTSEKQRELAARIFEDQGEVGRALAAMKTVQYTRRSVAGMQDTLKFTGNSPYAYLEDDAEFYKFAMSINDQIAAGKEKMKASGKTWAANALNLPRALMSTLDLSAPLRQGLFLIHKGAWWNSFFNMFRYFGDEQAFKDLREEIMSRNTYPLMMAGKVALSDINGKLSSHEEQFQTEWAQKIPGLGRLVRASERAYSGFLNKLRADVFDDLLAKLGDNYTEKDLQDLGRFINAASGRGNLAKGLQSSAPLLNGLFFSPRLISSRITMTTALIDPRTYTTMNKVARNEYIKSLLSVGGAALLVLSLAFLGGAEVEKDPRSSDFAKIKIGNTRYDILGGEGQYITLASRLIRASEKTSNGEIKPYGNDFGQKTRKDAFYKFGENKASPLASFAIDYLRGTNAIGEKFEADKAVADRFIPMLVMDVRDNIKEEGIVKGTAMTAPGIFGVGVQNYKNASTDYERELDAPETFNMQSAKDGEYNNVIVEDGVVKLDDKAQLEWTNRLNHYVREWMKFEVAKPEWKTMTTEERREVIKSVRNDARKETKADMLEMFEIEEEQ